MIVIRFIGLKTLTLNVFDNLMVWGFFSKRYLFYNIFFFKQFVVIMCMHEILCAIVYDFHVWDNSVRFSCMGLNGRKVYINVSLLKCGRSAFTRD